MPEIITLNQPGREVMNAMEQLMQAVLRQYPQLGKDMAQGFSVTISTSKGIALQMKGAMQAGPINAAPLIHLPPGASIQ